LQEEKSKQEVLDLAFAVATRVLSKKIGEKRDKELTQKFIKEI
jgi:F0F1-type ATP synthase membrane subunit b/b'